MTEIGGIREEDLKIIVREVKKPSPVASRRGKNPDIPQKNKLPKKRKPESIIYNSAGQLTPSGKLEGAVVDTEA